MSEAPRDGTPIVVCTWHGNVKARFQDCSWLREGPFGDPTIADCWKPERRHVDDDDIELDAALGWWRLGSGGGADAGRHARGDRRACR